MTLALTEEKMEKVILKCEKCHPQTTVLELTKLIDVMSKQFCQLVYS